MLNRKTDAEMSGVIIGERLAQLGDAALPSIKGFAGGERLHGGLIDEIGRGKIAFANPERQKAFTATGVIDDFDDPAFWRCDGARAEAAYNRHAYLQFTPS